MKSLHQVSLFERIVPISVYGHNPDKSRTIQTQARIYCSACGKFIGFGIMRSKRLSVDELSDAAREEYVLHAPFFDVTIDGRCMYCGVIVQGNGVINGGLNVKDDYWKW